MGRLTLLKAGSPPSTASYSDDFSGTSLNAKWSEYDPLNDVTVSVGGGVLTANVPANVDHDWWTGINTAMRLKQTYSGATNFTLDTKFTTTMTAGYSIQGLAVGTDNDNGIVFSTNYDPNGSVYAVISTIIAATGTNLLYSSASAPQTQPYYLRVAKSGTSYTFSTSPDGSSYTSYAAATYSNTVNYIGLIIGNTGGGGSAPAFTCTCDYFTYTAN